MASSDVGARREAWLAILHIIGGEATFGLTASAGRSRTCHTFLAVRAFLEEGDGIMSITYDDIGQDLRRIVISGRLDQPATDAVAEQLAELVAAPKKSVVVDLSTLRFLASIGLGALMAGAKAVQKRGGKMVLVVSESSTVMMSLEATGIDQLIPVFKSRSEAERAVAG